MLRGWTISFRSTKTTHSAFSSNIDLAAMTYILVKYHMSKSPFHKIYFATFHFALCKIQRIAKKTLQVQSEKLQSSFMKWGPGRYSSDRNLKTHLQTINFWIQIANLVNVIWDSYLLLHFREQIIFPNPFSYGRDWNCKIDKLDKIFPNFRLPLNLLTYIIYGKRLLQY